MGILLHVIARSEFSERRLVLRRVASSLVLEIEITAKAVIGPRNRKAVARNDNVWHNRSV